MAENLTENLALQAHKKSIAYATAGNREGWIGLFADDAVIHDPVGPSPHDPEGAGFRGKAGVAKFWDMMMGGTLVVVAHKRIPVGERICAVFMTATNVEPVKSSVEMVSVYESNEAGELISLKTYWDLNQAMAQIAEYSNAAAPEEQAND